MQSPQDRLGHDVIIDWDVVSVCYDPLTAKHRVREARPEAGMWPTMVIQADNQIPIVRSRERSVIRGIRGVGVRSGFTEKL